MKSATLLHKFLIALKSLKVTSNSKSSKIKALDKKCQSIEKWMKKKFSSLWVKRPKIKMFPEFSRFLSLPSGHLVSLLPSFILGLNAAICGKIPH